MGYLCAICKQEDSFFCHLLQPSIQPAPRLSTSRALALPTLTLWRTLPLFVTLFLYLAIDDPASLPTFFSYFPS